MKKLHYCINCMALALLLTCLLLPASATYAQEPLPPLDSDESWTPPEGSGTTYATPGLKSQFDSSSAPSEPSSSSSYYPYPPYRPITPVIMNAQFINTSGNIRTQFEADQFYLKIQINVPGTFYLAEYYPSDSGLSPHWLMYQYKLDRAGIWTLGPFYTDTYEPAGQHTWKMWLLNSGMWAQRKISFDYHPSTVALPNPSFNLNETGHWSTFQIMIVMVLAGALGITVGMLIGNRKHYSS